MTIKENISLQDTVIENGYCIGCGACEFLYPEKYKVELSEYGMYNADVKDEDLLTDLNVAKVCPFSNSAKNEDELSDLIFDEGLNYDHRIGKYINCYAGHVIEGDFRKKGSSGGFGKWLLNELLNLGEVDYVLQVEPNIKKGELFSYSVFEKGDDLLHGSKSAYYPVTLTDALNFIKNNKGKFAITALPCFSKAIRLLCIEDEILKKRIRYVIGIVCGHLKSTAFAESLSWQLGVSPNDLRTIEFRGKIEGRKANEKGVYALDKYNNITDMVSSRSLVGGDWGHGLFKYKACDYCDDIVGETADVSIGDAWLDNYVDDYKGANVLITRNKMIDEIIKDGIKNKRLKFSSVSKEIIVKSQAGGIRHRREGLSYRLYLKKLSDEWKPKKRIEGKNINSKKRKRIYAHREKLRVLSHKLFIEAKERNDINYFLKNINYEIEKYNLLYSSTWKKIIKKILLKLHLLDIFKKIRDSIIKK